MIDTWLRLNPYRNLVPVSARELTRSSSLSTSGRCWRFSGSSTASPSRIEAHSYADDLSHHVNFSKDIRKSRCELSAAGCGCTTRTLSFNVAQPTVYPSLRSKK